ncbi:hypothetical protein AB0K00_41900, partial [Dactylosporangium sp. NPDC049525]
MTSWFRRRRDPAPAPPPVRSVSAPPPQSAPYAPPVPPGSAAGAEPARQPLPPVPPVPPAPPASPPVFAGRFGSAAGALRFVGHVTRLGGEDRVRLYRSPRHWWVVADVSLDAGRELVQLGDGVAYTGTAQAMRPVGAVPAGDPVADPATWTEAAVADLVRAGGLHPIDRAPLGEAVLVMPGVEVAATVRRALDLGLTVQHRLARLHALFGPDGSTMMVELRLRSRDQPVPPSLLAAVAQRPLTAVCRRAGRDGQLLVQHGLGGPVPDDELAALVAEGTWLLADAAFGCWRVEPLAERYADSAGLARRHAVPELVSGPDLGDLAAVDPPPVRVVPARLPGQVADAALLDDGDLPSVALVLEGHPLAEAARLIPGRGVHLLLAAGGILARLPLGEPLAAVGPGLVYLPLGHRLSPQLPPGARAELFEPDEETAVVVLRDRVLRFALAGQAPVWRLWAGQPPPVDLQLPAPAIELLA